MSIFEESVWETDETGDKLIKQLSLSKTKVKAGKKSISQNGKNSKEKGRKKSKNIPSAHDAEGSDLPATTSKTDNKKRKSSAIDIDENIIKKWKLESLGQAATKPKANLSNKKLAEKLTKPVDKSNEKLKKGEAAINKKRNPDGKSERIDKKKKSNDSYSEIDNTAENLMTKSYKRRLKIKQKLLDSTNSSTSGEATVNSIKKENGKDISHSTGESSKKIDRSNMKIERIKGLLIEKQQSPTKKERKSAEPTSLRDRMMAKLKSSRFRYLNEQMYNNESWSSKKYFKEDPDAFVAYHEGYKLQVDQWPLNPLDTIIASIKRLSTEYIVADFGCGEARLADSVPQKVHSLDLVAVNDKVTACDMAHTSLLTGRIDVVVFCLSLMGTNLADYLIEANRVLRKDGILKIAEVESRFEDVDEFVKVLSSYGFTNTWKDLSHNLFYFMDFKKVEDITKKRNKLPPLTLKSCLYKRR